MTLERIPFVADILAHHPTAEISATDFRARVVDGAAAITRPTVLAPRIRRLVEFDDVQQFAAQTAFAAFASCRDLDHFHIVSCGLTQAVIAGLPRRTSPRTQPARCGV